MRYVLTKVCLVPRSTHAMVAIVSVHGAERSWRWSQFRRSWNEQLDGFWCQVHVGQILYGPISQNAISLRTCDRSREALWKIWRKLYFAVRAKLQTKVKRGRKWEGYNRSEAGRSILYLCDEPAMEARRVHRNYTSEILLDLRTGGLALHSSEEINIPSSIS